MKFAIEKEKLEKLASLLGEMPSKYVDQIRAVIGKLEPIKEEVKDETAKVSSQESIIH